MARNDVQEPNTLTLMERLSGWQLLFDGKTLNGWRRYRGREAPSGWTVEDGTLKHVGRKENPQLQRGDIVTDREFESFDLVFEWKIAPGGNSGLKYPIREVPGRGATGFEYQLIDDERHGDAKRGLTHSTGALYDLMEPKGKRLKPAGEWNQTRLVVQEKHVEHWLNGVKLLEFDMESAPMQEMIARSKYKNIQDFGKAGRGRILLQDHGDTIWFRSIKIRELLPR